MHGRVPLKLLLLLSRQTKEDRGVMKGYGLVEGVCSSIRRFPLTVSRIHRRIS